MQIAWAIVYFIMFILLVRHCPGFLRTFFRHWWLVSLVGLVLASSFWSAVPGTTFRRGVSVACTTFFGIYFALRYDRADQLQLLRKMCTIAVVSSFLFGIFHLGHSVDNLNDVWIGIYSQKNGLGRMMVFCALVYIVEGHAFQRSAFWISSRVGAAFSLILLSKSSTSFFVFCLLICTYFFRDCLRGSTRQLFAIFSSLGAGTALGLYWTFHHLGLIKLLLHKDVTLTGRLYIWVLGTVMALQKPWFGYGYSGFWLGPQGPSGRIWRALNWAAPGAHNGILELWLDLGLVGITIFLIGFLLCVWRAISAFRASPAVANAWPVMYLVFVVLMNFTESTLVGGNVIFWALYCTVAVDLSISMSPRPVIARGTKFLGHQDLAHGHA